MNNADARYGAVARGFHWTTTALIVVLLAMGFYMSDLPDGDVKFKFYGLHKSLGATVLGITVLRLVWRWVRPAPAAAGRAPWEHRLSATAHGALYLLLILMPLSGWAMSSAAGFPVRPFDLFTLPTLIAADKAWVKPLKEAHETLGDLIVILAGLHAAAALFHHWVRRDGVLRRMLGIGLGLLLAATTTAAAAPPVEQWHLRLAESRLTFEGTQMGAAFAGRFGLFTGEIFFDPDRLAESRVRIEIDLSTVSTGAPDRDEMLRGAEWFDVKATPLARFESATFRARPDGRFESDGTLTLRGHAVPTILTFAFEKKSKDSDKDEGVKNYIATVEGEATLDRSRFDLGGKSWKDQNVIANEVKVFFHLRAVTSHVKKKVV